MISWYGSGMTLRPLAAVIVNWNGADHTLRCLRSLSVAEARPDRVIVVDNGSIDDSVQRIRAEFPEVTLLEAKANLGYAGGNNLGLRHALESGARSLLILNNDIEVEPACIRTLEDELADPALGATGPIVLLPGGENRIWAAGGAITHRENVSRLRGFGEIRNGQFASNEDVDYLPGCAILVRSEVMKRIGMLDESFFCYMEDVDLGRRIAEAGYRNRFVPKAVVRHDASASTGGGYTAARKYMNAVNSVRFLKLHSSARGWLGFIVFDVLLWPLAFLNACLHGRPGAAFAKLRGILDGLRGVPVTAACVERYMKAERER